MKRKLSRQKLTRKKYTKRKNTRKKLHTRRRRIMKGGLVDFIAGIVAGPQDVAAAGTAVGVAGYKMKNKAQDIYNKKQSTINILTHCKR